MSQDLAPPSPQAIERARALIDVNCISGDCDDLHATIITGGMLGDVADLFDVLQIAADRLRTLGGVEDKAIAQQCDAVIAAAAYEDED